jgi:Glycosyl hydrolase catalytic core
MKPLLALAAALALLAVTPATAVRHPDYGVVTSVQFLEGAPLQRLQDLGVGSVRIGLDWRFVEPQPDRFDLGDPRIQGWIDRAHAVGLHVFATLGGPPDWAAPCAACMPYQLSDWYDYVAHELSQFEYLGSDITFGIWNEPNLSQFLFPPSPDLYGDLFDYADMARRDVNPSARLAGPETDHGALPSGFFAAAMTRLAQRFRPQDAITVHWYPGTFSPDLGTYMNEILRQAGTRDVWLTETGEKNPDDGLQQSRLLAIIDTFNRRATAQWAKIFVYRFWSPDPADPDTPFNLVRPDFTSRSAFQAYRDAMYRIFRVNFVAANGRYVTEDPDGRGSIRALSAAAGDREAFEIDDFNGGSLQTGDIVRIRAADGKYLQVAGRNRPLLATDDCACTDAGLFVVETSGSAASDVTLKSVATAEYASLDAGRAGDILVNRATAGAQERFGVVVK